MMVWVICCRSVYLSASSNTTYSHKDRFRFISIIKCVKRPGVAIRLRRIDKGEGCGGGGVGDITYSLISHRKFRLTVACPLALSCDWAYNVSL